MNKSDWLPIDSAPIKPFVEKEWFLAASPHVLLWCGRVATIGYYGYTKRGMGRWKNWHWVVSPTHWMPLPDGPEE